MSKKDITAREAFGTLFAILRGEHRSDLDNEQFTVLAEMLHAGAIARLYEGVERQNLTQTAGEAIKQQVAAITKPSAWPSVTQ
jgi:hypothetical protein